MTIEVEPPEGGQTVSGEKLVVHIYVVKVVHETKRSIGLAGVIALQPGDGLKGKGPDLIHGGLNRTIEVLKAIVCD